MEISDDIRIAKDVVQALLKAKKTIRMYPENNPIYKKTIEDTFSKFSDLFIYRDAFPLKIKQNDLLFDSEQVYHNSEKEDNLALFFFKDGLRELTFKRGLLPAELEEFLKIIALDFDREAVDDDIVTLLWEKDFQNIRYVADDAFLMEDEDYEAEAVKEIRGKAPETDEVLKAYASAFEGEDVADISIVNLTDKDLQLLVKEMEKDLEDKTGKIYDILFEMLFQAESLPEYEDIYHLLKEVFSYCIQRRDLRLVVQVLKKTRETAESPSLSEAARRQMNGLLSMINSPESVKSAGAIFDSEANVEETVLAEYLEFLDRTAIPPFMTLLGEMEGIHGRKIIINILIYLGKMDLQTIAKGLQDHRWYVVRNIIYILRHIGDKKAVEYLLNTARHTDERVRKEAIRALGELKSPLGLQTLRDCLNDSELSIRKSAVRALGSIASETAKRIILEKISGNDFRDRDFDEKKDFYEVLAHWNDSETTDFMVRTLKKKALFKRAKIDEGRACAAYCLGLMGSKDSLPYLYKLHGTKNRLLREYVGAAIKRIEHGR
ncbi:MAG: HEAT repeat domain-containing protein [Nitrospirae bacterium]|nr:HEAT repeat domain-containing protein [Nitrospirota bacterium]